MSFQAGTWNIDGQPANKQLLTQICGGFAELGPDGESTHVHQSIAILYRPLHATAESRSDRQPYRLRGGEMMTWDGRLDNRKELIGLLQLELKDDSADGAIVAAAFERWRTNAFAKLIGDWALVVWDSNDRELLLAKDYMGTRNLFYYIRANEVTWCTQLEPLAASGDALTLCDDYIAGYLAFHPDADLTPYREIRSVPPATFVSIKRSELTVHTYWRLDPYANTRYKTDGEYEECYRHLLRQAVRRRLRSSTPVLAELSGGLDSSSIVSMADDILAKEGAQTPGLGTLSYHDSSEPEDDDLAYITRLNKGRGKNFYQVDLAGAGDSLSFDYATFVARPGFGSRAELQTRLREVIETSGSRVVLSGLGGDEMNGQALNLCIQVADRLIRLQLLKASKDLFDWSLSTGRPWIQLLFRSLVEILPSVFKIVLANPTSALSWIEPAFARKRRIGARQLQLVGNHSLRHPIARDWMQTITGLRNLIAHGRPPILEKRYPYLDRTLVEFLTSIPMDQLIRPGQRRYLMRRALRDLLPRDVSSRSTKGTAVRCYCVTVAKHWKRIDSVLVSPLASRFGYINRNQLYAALSGMRNGQVPRNSVALLRALSLEFWLRDVVSRKVLSLSPSFSRTANEMQSEELMA